MYHFPNLVVRFFTQNTNMLQKSDLFIFRIKVFSEFFALRTKASTNHDGFEKQTSRPSPATTSTMAESQSKSQHNMTTSTVCDYLTACGKGAATCHLYQCFVQLLLGWHHPSSAVRSRKFCCSEVSCQNSFTNLFSCISVANSMNPEYFHPNSLHFHVVYLLHNLYVKAFKVQIQPLFGKCCKTKGRSSKDQAIKHNSRLRDFRHRHSPSEHIRRLEMKTRQLSKHTWMKPG